MATGLMGLLLGPATKLAPWLAGLDKVYEAEAVLGLSTDTGDLTGRETARHPGPWPGLPEIEAALSAMTGEVLQAPPSYSAIKVGGVAAHRAARAGRPLALAPRRVWARSLEALSYDPPKLRLRAHVGSGYYVRALARDLGEALGLGGGALSALRRLSVGPFPIERASGIPESREDAAERLISPREALSHLPELELDAASARKLGSGAFLPFPEGAPGGPYKIIGPGGALIALAEIAQPPDGGRADEPRRPFLRPLRVFGGAAFPAPDNPHAAGGE
jgi:tRNA pseudouridine55 synthase